MKKAQPIKLLIIDIDGTLTNGIIYYGNAGTEMRAFHVHDGMGLKLLRQSGVEVAAISAKNSELVGRRLKDLQIKHIYLGVEDKMPAYEKIKEILNLEDEQIAYMGDDLPDLPLLMRAGFAISVPNAPAIIEKHVDYTTRRTAGHGAVREACELIMQTQDTLDATIQAYLSTMVKQPS